MKFESGWYMASTATIEPKWNSTLGAIFSIPKQQGIYQHRLCEGVAWCLDNGVFTGKFKESEWIERMGQFANYKETCLFVVVPDVISDCVETINQFSHYRKMVKEFPVAFVSQDGIKEQAHRIPWDDFDCIFIGGSDEHKLGKEGGWILNEAKKRSKWVHVGRVNSASRILKFWQADSWDGTNLSFCPSNAPKFHAAVLQVRSMKKSKGLFDDIHNFVS